MKRLQPSKTKQMSKRANAKHQTMQGRDIYISSKLAMVELIMSGCTCSSDHLYIYPNDVCLEDSIRAAR